MADTSFTAPPPPSPEGLPAVKPPSAKFIAQLFGVPLLIVGGLVVLFFGIPWLFSSLFGVNVGWLGGNRMTPEQYLASLDKANPDVRWRAASDLAQVLLRDDQLASDPKFALDLTDRLQQTLKANEAGEKALAEKVRKLGPNPSEGERKAVEAERRSLEAGRNYVVFLCSSLGNFSVPAGLVPLRDLAEKETGAEPKLLAVRRWRVVFALANLGQNLKRFDRLPEERRQEVLDELRTEAAGKGDRAVAAKAALAVLEGRQSGKPTTQGVASALVKCADEGKEPFLREMAAFAMNFWDGDAAENARMEEALVRLTYDQGGGDDLLTPLYEEEDQPTRPVTSAPGLRVRYNATVALARRGSDKVRLSLLKEMLDEQKQLESHRIRRKDGSETPDPATACETVKNALQAVVELHRKRPNLDLSGLSESVEKLAHSDNREVQHRAKEAQSALEAKE
ncbi:MAG TPA: hypothetical protein VFA26_09480 [Gemmataceae bacterium]|nr:hypothetical protein [Gemmataceae bacterium]